MSWAGQMEPILESVYGRPKAQQALEAILPLLEDFPAEERKQREYFSERDVVLITYGDSLRRPGEAPLATFRDFAKEYFADIFSAIHFLPFFPYSSDDGFSVIDYFEVKPELGTWDDIQAIGQEFQLMFDLVLNHISAASPWFQHYLNGAKGFENLAIQVDPSTDLSGVTRPRALPLLTECRKASGETVHLWTTFSADQIDLNFADVNVLVRMIEVLLFYICRGARIIRLDAIAYLWKEIGTSCIHLRQTHQVVQLFRRILNVVCPDVILITETNVPHQENLSYFGDGHNEAQMVYNFTLPPLLLYAFLKEDTSVLSQWAATLNIDSEDNTFFNFTASHDGIGVRPLEGILSPEDIEQLARRVKTNGGRVSYKRNPDGSQSPYELNISYVDACAKGRGGDAEHAKRFLALQSIPLALPGVPAVYIHSILGSRNWTEGVQQTGRARTINREKLQADEIQSELNHPDSFRSRIFSAYRSLLRIRREQPAFHPNASLRVLEIHPKVFAMVRECPRQRIIALINVSSESTTLSIPKEDILSDLRDLITGEIVPAGRLQMEPYQTLWLSRVQS